MATSRDTCHAVIESDEAGLRRRASKDAVLLAVDGGLELAHAVRPEIDAVHLGACVSSTNPELSGPKDPEGCRVTGHHTAMLEAPPHQRNAKRWARARAELSDRAQRLDFFMG